MRHQSLVCRSAAVAIATDWDIKFISFHEEINCVNSTMRRCVVGINVHFADLGLDVAKPDGWMFVVKELG